MIVLAPPVLFTLGLGFSGIDPDKRDRFFDARVGYRLVEHVSVGIRLRRSHRAFNDGDVYSSSEEEINRLDKYDLDMTDIGAIADLEIGRWVVIAPWLGVHMSSGHAEYNESRTNAMTGEYVGGFHDEEELRPEPVFAAGLIVGVNVFSCGRVRVTGFAETQTSRSAVLSRRSLTYKPVSVGVAVQF